MTTTPVSRADKNAWQTLIDILLEPRTAFTNIRAHSAWLWLPMTLTMLASLAFILWYYNSVDIGWLRDQIISRRNISPTSEQARQMSRFITRGRILGFSSLSILIGIPFVYLTHALYFLLVGKVSGTSEFTFGSWLNFTTWTHFPGVLTPIATAIAYAFAANNQAFAIDPASLNSLFFHFAPASHWFQLSASITLFTLWSIALMAYGLVRWTNRKSFSAVTVALVPYVIYFGAWTILVGAKGR